MRKSTKVIGFAVTALTIVGAFGYYVGINVLASSKQNSASDVIPQNVTIEGKDVSGMTKEQATEVVNDYLDQYDSVKFTLMADDKSVVCDSEDLNVIVQNDDLVSQALNYGKCGNLLERYQANQNIANGKGKDFKLILTADNSTVKDYLTKNQDNLSTAAVNNGLKHENGKFIYVEGKEGNSLLIDESVIAITDYISRDWDGKAATIALKTKTLTPLGSKEELSAVKDVLGTYSTDYSTSSVPRKQNVANGASKINGTIIYPGEEYSVAKHLNPMSGENGYALAPSYENGTTVETYGGGICQVSTTLYNAVMRAELEIVTRSAHSMIVAYVEPSMDAAIAGDVKDFVFKNNQNYPVYLESSTNGSTITFSIYGKEARDPNRKVTFQSEVLSQTDPINVYEANTMLPVGTITKTSGSAHTGYTARLWKIVSENGKEVSRKVYNNSTYKVSNNMYAVGVASGNADAVNAMNAAIATQDQATIEAAAAQWNDAAVATQAATDAATQAAADTSAKDNSAGSDSKKESSNPSSKTTENSTNAQ